MQLFRERTRPAEIISVMALLSGIVALFALVSGFFPFLTPFLMVIVPLAPAFVALVCPLKFLPLFLLTSFGASLGVAFFDFQALLFYLLPSLCVGALYGLLQKKNVSAILNLFLNGVLSTILLLGTLATSKGIYGLSFYDLFVALFPLMNPNYAPDIFLLFCFTYGLAETLLIYLFAKVVFSKFHLPTNEEIHPLWLPYLCGGISLVLGVPCYFFFLPGSYLCLGFVIFWSVVAFVEEVPYQRSWLWAIQVVLLFVSILLFALLYTKLLEDRGLLLSSIPFILSFLPNALNASLPRLCVKNKINKP